MARTRVQVNEAALRRLTQSPAGPVVALAERIGVATVTIAKGLVRVDRGTLKRSISHSVRVHPGRVVMRAGTPIRYGLYLHEGTGIYGPKRRPIVPKSAKALRFKVRTFGRGGREVSPRNRNVVFALSVRGVKPDRWLVRAFEKACPYPVVERKL